MSRCRTPGAPTRSARWRAPSGFSRRRWSATATSPRRSRKNSAARAGAQPAYRSLRRGVPAGDRRRAAFAHRQCLGHAQTAQTITRVTSDANERAVAATGATTQASGNVSAVAGAAEELSASVQEIGRQVRHSAGAVEQTGQRTEKSITEIESLAAATQRIDGVLS